MIINLTQHAATPEQIAAGVVDLPAEDRASLVALLTFEDLPTADELDERAFRVAQLAAHRDGIAPGTRAMIGGAPFFMGWLERSLREHGIEPVYAFSRRESVEEVQPDGSVRKINVFRHCGFVC